MQQIFQFLYKNSHKLLFLLLLGISLILTIQSHLFHRSKVISSANFLTGGVYEQLSRVNEYFGLRHQNEILTEENAYLRQLVLNRTDTTRIDLPIDTIYGVNKSRILISKVTRNAYSQHENYLTINSGAKDGIKPDMGVVNSRGIVGIVEKTSKNYATVMSVLNVKSSINAKVKKSNHFGSLVWDGKSTGYVQLIDVPRLASVRQGDTIVTGGESHIFPADVNIGTINKIYTDDKTNYFTIQVKLFNDMTNISHVYIIDNKDREEIIELEKATRSE